MLGYPACGEASTVFVLLMPDGQCVRQAARPATTFYGESLRANTARTSFPAGRQSKAASRAALTTRCAIGDSLVRAVHPSPVYTYALVPCTRVAGARAYVPPREAYGV